VNNTKKCEKQCNITSCPNGQKLIEPDDGCCICVPDEYCIIDNKVIKSGQTYTIDECSYWKCTENCKVSGECQEVLITTSCPVLQCDNSKCLQEYSSPGKCCKSCRAIPGCQKTTPTPSYTSSTRLSTMRSTSSPCTLCNATEFCCDSKCLPHSFYCDGNIDCSDNFDELNCGTSTIGPFTTAVVCHGFPCSDGLCLPDKGMQCDGKAQCANHEDEEGCYSSTEHAGTSLKVTNGTTVITTIQTTPSGITTRIGQSSKPTKSTALPSTKPIHETTTTTEIETTKTYTTEPTCSKNLIPITCSSNGVDNDYDIDLGEEKMITGYKIGPNNKSFLKKFNIALKMVKSKKSKFEFFINPQNDEPFLLHGNDVSSNQEEYSLPNQVTARLVRIIPKSFATEGVEVYNMFSETAIKDYCKSLILKYAIGAFFQYLPYSVLSESRRVENFEIFEAFPQKTENLPSPSNV
jgi:hypothetical protein